MKDVTYGQFVWHSATRKRRVQQKMIHSRRRQDQLSRCRGHPNSRNVGGQDALQQRHINERSKILTYPWSVFLDYRGDHHQIQTQKATKKWSIYIRANRGIYGLSQAGLLANKLLEKRLNKHGYHQSNWNFGCVSNTFTMVVDDFGVKYVGEEHVNHLKATLEEHYKLT